MLPLTPHQYTQPLKMELIQRSETSANYNLTPGKYPEENIQYSNHGESQEYILYLRISCRRVLLSMIQYLITINQNSFPFHTVIILYNRIMISEISLSVIIKIPTLKKTRFINMYRNDTLRFSLLYGTNTPFVCRKKKFPR